MKLTEKEKAEILLRAQKNFKMVQGYVGDCHKRFLEDYKFANADSDNGFQWPNDLRMNRDIDERPCLTINKTRVHNLMIVNDAKMHKPEMKARPQGNGATFEAAQIWNQLLRRIEYQSLAQGIYDNATNFMVAGGWAFWRVVTEYVDPTSFDQEIYIKRVPDPLSVYIDPDAMELDKSDMKFAHIFESMGREKFKTKYPKYAEQALTPGGQSVLNEAQDWVDEYHIRVCEYYEVKTTDDEIYLAASGEVYRKSELDLQPDIKKELDSDPNTRTRATQIKEVWWYFIVGNTLVEYKYWPGTTIPLVFICAEETVIDGKLDRKGHTRSMKDPQRMYNYWSSAAVEFGALQTKTPWIAPAGAIEGYETIWNDANRINYSVLPFNAFDDAGQPMPPPERVQPPVAAPVALTGMQVAQQELMMASGQYDNQMGEQGNERTGKAIVERQRQGDKATYHYIDALAIGICRTGKIIMELVPIIYDTKRVMQILAEDGKSFELTLDPQADQIYQQELGHDQEITKRVLNPKLGKFDVIADIGPAYASKREEAFTALTLILTQAPQLASIIGDLLFEAGDFPMADKVAERLRRMVPPQALGKGPSPQEQQLTAELQKAQGALSKMADQITMERLKIHNKAEQKEVDVYRAISERLKIMLDGQKQGHDVAMDLAQLMQDLAQGPLENAQSGAKEDLGQGPQDVAAQQDMAAQGLLQGGQGQTAPGGQMQLPLSGGSGPPPPDLSQMRKAPDGFHYVPDPKRPGKYLRVHL